MFVSGAAFSIYKTALVIILLLQFLQPLFFLLALFGFDWISLNLLELPHALGLPDVCILILLLLKHLQILLQICPRGSCCVLQLPVNYTIVVFICRSIKSVESHAQIPFVPLLMNRRLFLALTKAYPTLKFSWAL